MFFILSSKVSEQPSRKRAGTADSIQSNKDYPVYVNIASNSF